MYILKVGSTIENEFEKGTSDKRLNLREDVAINEAECNGGLGGCGHGGHRQMRDDLDVKLAGLDGLGCGVLRKGEIKDKL